MTTTFNGRLIHEQTASAAGPRKSHYSENPASANVDPLLGHRPLSPRAKNSSMATTAGLRYSLNQGKKSMSAAMQKALRRSSASSKNSSSSHRQGGQDDSLLGNRSRRKSSHKSSSLTMETPPAVPATPDVSSADTSPTNSQTKTKKKDDSSPAKTSSRKASPSSNDIANGMIKIFLLLLEPRTKTFELIQLVFPTATTSIGDILRMIPQHATELALGSQTYLGLCRPKDGDELTNLQQSSTEAKVQSGEILVAIPKDFSVAEVTKFSSAILTNRRFTKLLRRSHPHGSKHGSSSSKHHKKHRHHGKAKHRPVHILEKHEEVLVEDDEQQMQRALEKAATAAAQANANIPSSAFNSSSFEVGVDRSVEDEDELGTSQNSFASSSWIDGGASTYSLASGYTATSKDSLGESLSSWSKSLDASFAKRPRHARHGLSPIANSAVVAATSIASPNHSFTVPNSPRGRRRPQDKRYGQVLALVMAVGFFCAYLIGCYHLRQQHYAAFQVQRSPMGLTGLLQVAFWLLLLRKLQFLAMRRRKTEQRQPKTKSKCPAVRIYSKVLGKKSA